MENKETIIILKGENDILFNELLKEIEKINGTVRQAFPTIALIVCIPENKIKVFKNLDGVEIASVDEIDLSSLTFTDSRINEIIIAWNQLLISKCNKDLNVKSNSIAWDAPGFLPPDLPNEIKGIFKELEDKYNKESEIP